MRTKRMGDLKLFSSQNLSFLIIESGLELILLGSLVIFLLSFGGCSRLFFCCYKEIPEAGQFIRKRALIGSQFCWLYRKSGAGICLALGEASRSLQSWWKVTGKWEGRELPRAFKQPDLARAHNLKESIKPFRRHLPCWPKHLPPTPPPTLPMTFQRETWRGRTSRLYQKPRGNNLIDRFQKMVTHRVQISVQRMSSFTHKKTQTRHWAEVLRGAKCGGLRVFIFTLWGWKNALYHEMCFF